MECDRCLICYTDLTNCSKEEVPWPCSERETLSSTSPSPPILSKDLHTISILKNLFEVPSEILENHLAEFGNPSTWSLIRFCGRCEGVVDNTKKIYQDILEASRKFTAVKGEIVKSVRRSWRNFEGERGGNRARSFTNGKLKLVCGGNVTSIVEQTRKFICEHDYGPSQDPFIEADLLASCLPSQFFASTPMSSQREVDMIKIERNSRTTGDEDDVEDNTCGEYMEQEQGSETEVEDREWVVGEVLQPDFNLGRLTLPPNELMVVEVNPMSCFKTARKARPVPNIRPIPNLKQIHKIKPTPNYRPTFKSEPTPNYNTIPKIKLTPHCNPIPKAKPAPNYNPIPINIPKSSVKPMPKIKPIPSSSTAIRKATSENFSYLRNAPAKKLFLQEQTTNNSFILPHSQIEIHPISTPAVLKCDYPGCDLVFTKLSMLTIHKRRHTGDKPFQCPWQDCGWRFIRKDELTRHYRKHTGDKPFKCPFCPKDFLRSDHCRKHVKGVHKMESGDFIPVNKDGNNLFP